MKLADLQAQFQNAILKGGGDILAHIPDSPLEKKETLFGVYRDAYVLRLAGIIAEDFDRLHTYVGDESFEKLTNGYIAAHPSHTPNARYFAAAFPGFVAEHEMFAEKPAVAAIAKLEGLLSDVFDVADAPALTIADLAPFKPEDFERLSFKPHPSARRFDANVNLLEIWTALSEEKTPPPAETPENPQAFLVWRKDVTPHYRKLAAEEAMMWDEAAKGVRFGVLCEMLATYDDPETSPLRAAQYLQTWISDGALASVSRV